jgi:uncharacterized protein YjeT (DUF2065 family)
MRREYWIALWIVIVLVGIGYMLPDDNWSMVYEAVQTPEVPGGQKRFVLFNEDHLSRKECTDLFNEHLRRLNNNAAVIEYEIGCGHLHTKGHGVEFQRQIHWMIGP